jgi:hypothetical protein
MRTAFVTIVVLASLTSATAAIADAYSDAAAAQAGLPYTPSGVGDPEAITCRAPQPLPGGGMGPKSCVRNSVWGRLTNSGKDLSADGKSVFDRDTVDEPSGGEGPPGAITCRTPQRIPNGWHLPNDGPKICLTNGTWAQLKARHLRISANGKSVTDGNRPLPIPGFFGDVGSASLSMLPAQVVQ